MHSSWTCASLQRCCYAKDPCGVARQPICQHQGTRVQADRSSRAMAAPGHRSTCDVSSWVTPNAALATHNCLPRPVEGCNWQAVLRGLHIAIRPDVYGLRSPRAILPSCDATIRAQSACWIGKTRPMRASRAQCVLAVAAAVHDTANHSTAQQLQSALYMCACHRKRNSSLTVQGRLNAPCRGPGAVAAVLGAHGRRCSASGLC